VRFFVESWSPEYGASFEAEAEAETAGEKVDVTIECPAEAWAPVAAKGEPARSVVFVDGVQQVDARVWLPDGDGAGRMGICVSYAAGTVRCNGSAAVETAIVRRGAFGPADLGEIDCGRGVAYSGVSVGDASPGGLDAAVRRQREDLEVEAARAAEKADLVVVDGHVRQRETIEAAVGYLKSHQAEYLAPAQAVVVGRLAPGERTPVFLLDTAWSRYSWYLKLPGAAGHAWAGVVRCEASPSLRPSEAVRFADLVSATLPRFASEQYKDPRAPQNLYPVAGLERELRRRLGDQRFLLRALQRAARA